MCSILRVVLCMPAARAAPREAGARAAAAAAGRAGSGSGALLPSTTWTWTTRWAGVGGRCTQATNASSKDREGHCLPASAGFWVVAVCQEVDGALLVSAGSCLAICASQRYPCCVCVQVYLHLRLEAQRRRQQRDFQAEYVQVGAEAVSAASCSNA